MVGKVEISQHVMCIEKKLRNFDGTNHKSRIERHKVCLGP